MYSIKEVLNRNPVQISAAVVAVVNFGIIMDWLEMTGTEVAGLNVVLITVLGLFVTTQTVNRSKLSELSTALGEPQPTQLPALTAEQVVFDQDAVTPATDTPLAEGDMP